METVEFNDCALSFLKVSLTTLHGAGKELLW